MYIMFEEKNEDGDLYEEGRQSESVQISGLTYKKGWSEKDVTTSLRSCFKAPQSPGKSRKRKFPGPAGIFPKASSLNKNEYESKSMDKFGGTKGNQHINDNLSPNTTDPELFGELWRAMLMDYNTSEDEIRAYCIAKLKEQSLPGSSKKTPILLVAIKSIDTSSSDPSCSLVDPSGSINGMIHRDVMEVYRSHLSIGSVLVLRNVAILMTLRNHYVNVTLNNLLSIYHPASSPQRILVSSKRHPSNILQILEEAKVASRLKDLNDESVSSKNTVGNPFIKSPVHSTSSIHSDFQFKKPQTSSSSTFQSLSTMDTKCGNLLEGLDEDSLFGDF